MHVAGVTLGTAVTHVSLSLKTHWPFLQTWLVHTSLSVLHGVPSSAMAMELMATHWPVLGSQ